MSNFFLIFFFTLQKELIHKILHKRKFLVELKAKFSAPIT